MLLGDIGFSLLWQLLNGVASGGPTLTRSRARAQDLGVFRYRLVRSKHGQGADFIPPPIISLSLYIFFFFLFLVLLRFSPRSKPRFLVLLLSSPLFSSTASGLDREQRRRKVTYRRFLTSTRQSSSWNPSIAFQARL